MPWSPTEVRNMFPKQLLRIVWQTALGDSHHMRHTMGPCTRQWAVCYRHCRIIQGCNACCMPIVNPRVSKPKGITRCVRSVGRIPRVSFVRRGVTSVMSRSVLDWCTECVLYDICPSRIYLLLTNKPTNESCFVGLDEHACCVWFRINPGARCPGCRSDLNTRFA